MYYQSVSVQSVDVKSANQRPGQARTGGGISVSRMPDQAHRESGEQYIDPLTTDVTRERGGERAGHATYILHGMALL